MGRWAAKAGKKVAEMTGGGVINWFPGHMAAATRAIRDRLKLADLVIEVRDARIPLSSANQDLQSVLSSKKRVIALNKKDLANPNIMHGWVRHFESCKQDCISISAHSNRSVDEVANHPSIYVLDTPGVLVPSIPDVETGLKLALTGAIKDSIVGETRLAQYLLAVLNTRKTPLHWDRLHNDHIRRSSNESLENSENILRGGMPRRRKQVNGSDLLYIEDLVMDVQRTLYRTFSEFNGNLEEASELESLVDIQLMALRRSFRIPHKTDDESHDRVSKKLLTLFRTGKLGPFILDSLPHTP